MLLPFRLENRFIKVRQLARGHPLVVTEEELKGGSLFTLPWCPEGKAVPSLNKICQVQGAWLLKYIMPFDKKHLCYTSVENPFLVIFMLFILKPIRRMVNRVSVVVKQLLNIDVNFTHLQENQTRAFL